MKLKILLHRIRVAKKILKGDYQRFFLVHLKEEELISLFKNRGMGIETDNIEMDMIGLLPLQAKQTIKFMSSQIDITDLQLEHLELEEKIKNKNK